VEVRRHRRARAVGSPAVGGVRTLDPNEHRAASRRRERGLQGRSTDTRELGHRGRSPGEGARMLERMSTRATGGWGAGPQHLKVGNEVAADRVMDVDSTATNPNLLGGLGDRAAWRSSRSEMGRRRRVSRLGALKP